ncbi:Rossmann-fold NAD(P)-binding domain-containing protein [Flammeovirga kamogawensis]|uniref:Epimerase n=1 Tax=Flammeovirga kamogawensis TaxID=373891 RepID=A0ABX8GVD8_9BACT|nr:epimerase [Flammeovirga kamogawensis]MBB6459626.1 hypothetical protein [Flammeovirga kamogawensis]QWG07311.1 epimerase [Flammeovirga kamogawensis]TRX69128.1 epimerase [Flammeovirga kamogawensis]
MEKIKAIITGATGMVGKSVLLECLDSDKVEKVLIIVRESIGMKHPKLEEVIHKDFFDLTDIIPKLVGYNACYFCLGISSAGVSIKEYSHITYDLTLHFANIILPLNPDISFCYVSGAGTSSKENSATDWANVKGKTENQLLKFPFKSAYMFRPAVIQPEKGVESKVSVYKTIYKILRPVFPILDRLFPKYVTTSTRLGKAMINVVNKGYKTNIIENDDINALSAV